MAINKTSELKENVRPESSASECASVCNNFKLEHTNGSKEVYI